jgi:hypothetical protein
MFRSIFPRYTDSMGHTPRFGDKKSPRARPSRVREPKPLPESATLSPDSIAAQLLTLGEAVPIRAWAKLPPDYFGNIDHYLHGASKNK